MDKTWYEFVFLQAGFSVGAYAEEGFQRGDYEKERSTPNIHCLPGIRVVQPKPFPFYLL
jgi:hypothetical protein